MAPDSGAAPDGVPDGPRRLSSTGLYADIATRAIADGNLAFAPRYPLWSDGAVKRRWLALPPGTVVDTSDPAHWRLPVGARLWKEFAAESGTLLETRLIERVAATGDDDQDYAMTAFVWLDDDSDAVADDDGADDVRGTSHDVPSAVQCRTCHGGEPGNVLGLSTLQLSGAGDGARLVDLAAMGALGPAPPAEYAIPGGDITAAALGALHANCGHCHNPTGAARPDVDMTLQLDLAAASPEDTTIWRATIGVPLFRFRTPPYQMRVVPGEPAISGLLHRMEVRGSREQMPPIASERVDDASVAAVRSWIEETSSSARREPP
jgi:hypothetical protein